MSSRAKVLPRAEKNAGRKTPSRPKVLRQKSRLNALNAASIATEKRGNAWLAEKLGVSRPRVSQLTADRDWRWGPAPWTATILPEVQAWIAERRAANNATAERQHAQQTPEEALAQLSKNPERLAKIKLLIERTASIKLDREMKSGNFIPKEDVETSRVQRVYAVRTKLQEIPLRAPLLAMRPAAEIEAQLKLWMQEICNHFASN